jgi:GT2 family glycosyltransferase
VVNFTMQVRDRFNLTKQALTSLAAAGMVGMTVTVLDDRSGEQTQQWVRDWCTFMDAHYVRNDEPRGTGQLRNMVMEESRKYFGQGEYVAPHDNDTFFKPGWLEKMVEYYKIAWPSEFRLIGAYGHPYHLPIKPEGDVVIVMKYRSLGLSTSNIPLHRIKEVQALATQSMFMDWNTWDAYGPFCDTPVDKTCQSEDVDFTNRIRAAGYKLGVVTPHLVHATALKNTFGEPGPGWELVKAACPPGVICE